MSDSVRFDRAADFYDQTRAFPPGTEPQIIEMVRSVGNLNGNSRVLEIGVGTGRVALPLARDLFGTGGNGHFVGIDLAIPMMQRLRHKQTDERVHLAQADVLTLPFAADSFDGAIAVDVFHLIPDWKAALAEVGRVLKPGARLVNLWTVNFHNPLWWGTWDAAISVDTGLRRSFDNLDVQQFTEQNGWHSAGEMQALTTTRYQTPRHFLEQLHNRVWSSTWRLSDAALADGIAKVRAVMDEAGHELDTPIANETRIGVQAVVPPR